MLKNNKHYKNIESAVDHSCTCEVLQAIATICREKAIKAKAKGNSLILEERKLLHKRYTEYADYLENFVVTADLPCPSQCEDDILNADWLGDFT